MHEAFADLLRGGHPNSLGRTEQVVGLVLADRGRLEELFATMADPDAVVRMRVGDALEKVCRERPEWFVPHVETILDDLGNVDQPSVQWHVAQLLDHLRAHLTARQVARARSLLQRNLVASTDWIVLNVTMVVLADWAADDPDLRRWLIPELERLRLDRRKSVAKRAAAQLARITGDHPG